MHSWKRNLAGFAAGLLCLFLLNAPLAGAAAVDPLTAPEWPVKTTDYGGKLLLSDSPETVPADGITYQDFIQGDARLFFHHVNGTKEPKKIVVWLHNKGTETAKVTVGPFGVAGPGYDYLQIGKQVQLDYFTAGNFYIVDIPPGESRSLHTALDAAEVKTDMLVNGMYDLHTEQPVLVSVMMMPLAADPLEFSKTAQVLPTDASRLRGTFPAKDRMLVPTQAYDSSRDGLVAITLADHRLDRYVTGVDATDGTTTLNYGNYGIVYQIYIPSLSGGAFSYYLNPRGGEYAGALYLQYRHQEHNILPTPADRTSFGSNPLLDKSYLGTFGSGRSLWLTFSPPGASNLPVKLLLQPERVKK